MNDWRKINVWLQALSDANHPANAKALHVDLFSPIN